MVVHINIFKKQAMEKKKKQATKSLQNEFLVLTADGGV